MRKHQLFCLLLTVLCMPLQAQVSFGVKAGWVSWTPNQNNRNIADSYEVFLYNSSWDTYVERITNDQVALDSFANFSKKEIGPQNLEFGAYLSIALAKRSRLKLEFVFQQLDLTNGDTDMGTIVSSDSIFNSTIIRSGSFIYTFQEQAPCFRPALEYQYYLGRNFALNLGVSYSMPFRDVTTRGRLHMAFDQERTRIYRIVDAFEQITLTRKQGLPGVNGGFLIKIGNLPKIEARVAHYFPPFGGNTPITGNVRVADLNRTLDYTITPYPTGYTQLIVFLEL